MKMKIACVSYVIGTLICRYYDKSANIAQCLCRLTKIIIIYEWERFPHPKRRQLSNQWQNIEISQNLVRREFIFDAFSASVTWNSSSDKDYTFNTVIRINWFFTLRFYHILVNLLYFWWCDITFLLGVIISVYTDYFCYFLRFDIFYDMIMIVCVLWHKNESLVIIHSQTMYKKA